jgi:hypothetical protein
MLGIVIILVSCVVLLGWYKGIPFLHSGVPGLPPMVPDTALVFIALASSFLLSHSAGHHPHRRYIGKLLVAACILLNGMILVVYLYGMPAYFMPENIPAFPNAVTYFLLMPAPQTSISFFLGGIALLLSASSRTPHRNLSQWLALGTALVPVVVLTGYIYGQSSLYVYSDIIGMSVITAICFILLAAALLLASPDTGLMGMITGGTVGAMVARRMFPTVIFVPLVLGWLILVGYSNGWYTAEFGITLLVVLTLLSPALRKTPTLPRFNNG